MTTVHIYHAAFEQGVPRTPTYSYETDRTQLEQIFRDNNAVDGDPATEVNVRMNKRSLSMGDIVSMDGKFWMCEALGWTQVTKEDIWTSTNSPTHGDGTTTTCSSQERTPEPQSVIESLLDSLERSIRKHSKGPIYPPGWWG
jgi:hypothetical protein